MAKVYDKRASGGTASRGTASTALSSNPNHKNLKKIKKAPSSGTSSIKKASGASVAGIDKKSILATGNGPISAKTLAKKVKSGEIGVKNGKAYSTSSGTSSIKKASGGKKTTLPYKPGTATASKIPTYKPGSRKKELY